MAGGNKEKGKGGGARKYGQNIRKCGDYRLREARNETRKSYRIAKRLKRFPNQKMIGWFLAENGRAMRG